MDPELKPPFSAPGVPGWTKEEAFQGRRRLVRRGEVEADGTETGIILGEPQPEVSALENLQALNAEVFAAEDGLRVPFAEGAQELEVGHECGRDLAQMSSRIGFPWRREDALHLREGLIQRGMEGTELLNSETETRGDLVTAEAAEMSAAGVQGLVKVDADGTPPRAFPAVTSPGEQDGRSGETLCQSGCDESQESLVPGRGGEHQDSPVGILLIILDLGQRLGQRLLLQSLAAAIQVVEFSGEPPSLFEILGEEEAKGEVGAAQPPGGIQSGAEPEEYIPDTHLAAPETAHFLEGADPRPGGLRQNSQSRGREDAIGEGEGSRIRQSTQGNPVQVALEVRLVALVPVPGAAKAGPKSGHQVEGHPHSSQVPELIAIRQPLGVDENESLTRSLGQVVVVGDDHLQAELFGETDGLTIGATAVYRNKEPYPLLLKLRHGSRVQTVAVEETMGQVPSYLGAETRQEVKEEGGRGDTIHVVVPKDCDGLIGTESVHDAGDGRFQIGNLVWIGKVLEPAGENAARRGGLIDAAGG